ncbi:MAG: hypothetical protein Q4C46_05605 [Bacillota bacterium]|nr:hypothetical protein [Bacillota bacterium]
MPEGIIITKVDRVPDSCFDCEMHDDVDWCPFAGECVGIYARIKKMNPRCPIKPMPEKKTDNDSSYQFAWNCGYNVCLDKLLGGKR